ncbi:hypothetical protein [Methylobacter svalbardensis]|uniref:hypothetical protein n=1 Tax=Methylobacter svalbardensis TaxID=3080016 RepID=UPI0030EDCD39
MLQALALLLINLTITIAITSDPATSSLTRGIVKLWNFVVLAIIIAFWGNLKGIESHYLSDIVHTEKVRDDFRKAITELPNIEQQNKLIKKKLDELRDH